MDIPVSIFWFRRDLRLQDNRGLYEALRSDLAVLPIFIFDKNILNELPNQDPRVAFIYDCILKLKAILESMGSSLLVLHDKPYDAFLFLLKNYNIKNVYTNHDYESYAVDRDREISVLLHKHKVQFKTFKDQVIFEKDEVLKNDGSPYTVFTPYSKKWMLKLDQEGVQTFNFKLTDGNFIASSSFDLPSIIDPECDGKELPKAVIDREVIRNYDQTRDFPAINGTSRLGIHLRFGTISIRELVKTASETNRKFLSELIWREFYQMIIWHFPYVVNRAFKRKYDDIPWENNEDFFRKWCEGKTGFPIVDAGMRELNETGFMHNRVRMIAASFLTKDLLIDWRWGEAYFAKKLLDYELASNNGNWQWAASTGVDAAPYFRVFNPYTQALKFDAKGEYVRKWVPELGTSAYPKPIVEHDMARKRCIEIFKNIL